MPHKRYKHSECHKNDRPKCLKRYKDCELDERPSQTLPKQYKHRKRHKNVHRQHY